MNVVLLLLGGGLSKLPSGGTLYSNNLSIFNPLKDPPARYSNFNGKGKTPEKWTITTTNNRNAFTKFITTI